MASEKMQNDIASQDVPSHLHTEDHLKPRGSVVIRNARTATEKEHKMTLWQGIKLYPKAVGWSLLISTVRTFLGFLPKGLSHFPPFVYSADETPPVYSYGGL